MIKKYLAILIATAIGFTSTAQIVPNGATAPQLSLPAVPAAYNSDVKVNIVRTWDARKATQDASASSLDNNANFKTATSYFDGLGRPLQTVVKGNNYDGTKDIIGMNVYDEYGREAKQYLPYTPAAGSTGKFRLDPFVEQQTYYNTNYQDQTPFSKTNFEASPINRPTTAYAPGNNWTGSNRGVSQQYLINTLADDVKMISIANTAGAVPTFANSYPAGELYKNISIDEHGKQVVEFNDKENKVILKKVQLHNATTNNYTDWLCTYYVYDDFNRLRYVLQPKAVATLSGNSWSLTTAMQNELCFRYEYDADGRMIMKKVPGAAAVYMCYDKRDRLVFIQDGNLNTDGKWKVSFYDELNRPASTALYATTQTQAQLQTYLDGIITENPIPVLTESSLTRLTYTYYDEYSMPGATAFNQTYINSAQANISPGDEFAENLAKTELTRGMVTSTKTRILNTTNFISSTTYYDTKARAVQSHTTNINNGTDAASMVYSFTGKVMSSYLVHNNPNATLAGTQTIEVFTKNTYNNDYLLKIEKKINNGDWTRIAQMEYDDMGNPKKKWMGKATSNFYVNMDYNIRGWLTGINKQDQQNLENGSISSSSFYNAIFSEVLSYDYGYTKQNYNGNISGIKWANASDKQARSFGYDYDNVNRLMVADFTQKESSSWTNSIMNFNLKMGNGTNTATAYDENGNIKRLQQWAYKLTGNAQIDDLNYVYGTTSNPLTNKLNKVTDAYSDPTTKLGDFKDGTNTNDDYSYDVNGNMVQDNNKAIGNIAYNFLNLPQTITVTGKGTIDYVYDAAGNKLKKIVHETGKPDKTTTYIAGFVYENNAVQFVSHEEGRARYATQYNADGTTTQGWFYDYFYKDHLGNIRSVVTEQKDVTKYMATFETAQRSTETALFNNINETAFLIKDINQNGINESCIGCIVLNESTNYPTDNTTNPNQYTSRLNGEGKRIGAAITLKVMAGDKIDLGTKVWYPESGVNGLGNADDPEDVFNSLLNTLSIGAATLSGSKASPIELSTTSSPLWSGVQSYLDNHPEDGNNAEEPRAYLNWMLIDEQFKYVPEGSGFIRVPGFDEAIQTLAQQEIPMPKSGYLFVYLSNETRKRDVFFDNLVIQHTTGPLSETTDYTAWGLDMKMLGSKAFGRVENKNKFNDATELDNDFDIDFYETQFRSYDPQIGRFLQIDPLSTFIFGKSGYIFGNDNPISFNDKLGLDPETSTKENPKELDGVVLFGNKKKDSNFFNDISSASRLLLSPLNYFEAGSDNKEGLEAINRIYDKSVNALSEIMPNPSVIAPPKTWWMFKDCRVKEAKLFIRYSVDGVLLLIPGVNAMVLEEEALLLLATEGFISREVAIEIAAERATANIATKTGWKVGEPITNLTAKGNVPAWSTVRQRFWKNEALLNGSTYSESNLLRMQKGLAPQRLNPNTGLMESMELHHHIVPQRNGGLFDFMKVWPDEHRALDPFRR